MSTKSSSTASSTSRQTPFAQTARMHGEGDSDCDADGDDSLMQEGDSSFDQASASYDADGDTDTDGDDAVSALDSTGDEAQQPATDASDHKPLVETCYPRIGQQSP